MKMLLLEAKGLTLQLPDRAAKSAFGRPSLITLFRDVDLSMESGESVGIVGESGSGKTSLARTLLRLYEPSAGSLHFKGREITRMPEQELRPLRAKFQSIFQDPLSSLNPRHRIGTILAQPLFAYGRITDRRAGRREACALLERVGLPATFADRFAHELSGGQRQRVGICRALIQNPELLLVDEPTASLDPKTSRQIMRLIKELCAERKLSAIINIHDVMLAQMFAERIVGLQLGEIVYDGPPNNLTSDVLTKIYGEEDWSATIRKIDDEAVEGEVDEVIPLELPLPSRDRMAGLT
jgi:phosphonate transport system ATP-binding protein